MALDLGKQVGPLPLGAWFAVVGTGLGIAYYTRQNGGGTTVTRDTTTDPLTGEDTVGTGPGWVAVPPPSSAPTDTPPQDNDEWGRLAINYLIGSGYDPALSQSAIGKALQGTKMSVREWTLWGIALRHLGAPPFAVDVVPPVATPGPVNTPHPTPKPPAPKPPPSKHPTHRYYTVRPGDSLSKIARKYYHDAHDWHRIYDANRAGKRRADGHMGMIHNPNVIHVGWRLLIP